MPVGVNRLLPQSGNVIFVEEKFCANGKIASNR